MHSWAVCGLFVGCLWAVWLFVAVECERGETVSRGAGEGMRASKMSALPRRARARCCDARCCASLIFDQHYANDPMVLHAPLYVAVPSSQTRGRSEQLEHMHVCQSETTERYESGVCPGQGETEGGRDICMGRFVSG